jgi:TatD DNase family protein
VITDSHAHVWWDSYAADLAQVLARARAAGVDRMVVVGTTAETSRAAFQLCSGRSGLYPTAGIHPHDADQADAAARSEIERLARRPECVAVGETGLDLFKEYSPRAAQLASFHWHLDLARELDKPVVVHCRDAHEETAAALTEHPGVRGVMHCYTMGPDELEPYLEAGLYISFSGVVTYPRNDANRAAARAVPEERLLVETDCPFLAPQGHRGRRNEPALVREVLACVARERGVDLDHLARSTSANAARLFGLDERG